MNNRAKGYLTLKLNNNVRSLFWFADSKKKIVNRKGSNKKTFSSDPVSKDLGKNLFSASLSKKKRNRLTVIVFALVVLLTIYFYCQDLTIGKESVQRWFLLVLAAVSPGSYTGLLNTLPDYFQTPQISRLSVLVWKWICLLSAFGIGSLFLKTIQFEFFSGSVRNETGAQNHPAGIAERFKKRLVKTGQIFTVKNFSGSRNRSERFFFAFFSGLVLWSVYFQYAALFGKARTPFWITALTVLSALYGLGILLAEFRTSRLKPKEKARITGRKKLLWSFLVLFLFAYITLYSMGAMIPVAEYDMLEYHLQGVREIFDQGKIDFSSCNVYKNMPFGAEMLLLWGRSLSGNEMTGILIGKELIAASALIAALGIYAFCVRFFRSKTGGFLSAVFFLSFAYNYQVFSIGLNDGILGLAVFASIYSLLLYWRCSQRIRLRVGQHEKGSAAVSMKSGLCLTALSVAFAVSCKYTAVVFLLIPVVGVMFYIEIFLFSLSKKREQIRAVSLCSDKQKINDGRLKTGLKNMTVFALVILIFGGGWYVKNLVYTGNPFYPLAWSVFGDSTGSWNAEKNIRWKNAHSPSGYGLKPFAERVSAFVCSDHFASPFYLLLLPIAAGVSILYFKVGKSDPIPLGTEKKIWFFLLAYLIFFIFGWGFLTHRLLRFLVPVLPTVSVLAGIGFSKLFFEKNNASGRTDKKTIPLFMFGSVCLILALGFVYSFLNSWLCQQDYCASPEAVQRDPMRFGQWTVELNDAYNPGQDGILLLIGDARGFAWKWPILYNTCWDNSSLVPILEEACTRNGPNSKVTPIDNHYPKNQNINDSDGKKIGLSKGGETFSGILDPALIKSRLHEKNISLILVDYNELNRFRSPGNYGYSDPEINEDLFNQLEKAGVLAPLPDKKEAPGIRVYRVK